MFNELIYLMRWDGSRLLVSVVISTEIDIDIYFISFC